MGKAQRTPRSAAGRFRRSRFPGAPLPFLSRRFRGKRETWIAILRPFQPGTGQGLSLPGDGPRSSPSALRAAAAAPARRRGRGGGAGGSGRCGLAPGPPRGCGRGQRGGPRMPLLQLPPGPPPRRAALPLGAGAELSRPPPAPPPQSLRRRGSDVTRHCQICQEMNFYKIITITTIIMTVIIKKKNYFSSLRSASGRSDTGLPLFLFPITARCPPTTFPRGPPAQPLSRGEPQRCPAGRGARATAGELKAGTGRGNYASPLPPPHSLL